MAVIFIMLQIVDTLDIKELDRYLGAHWDVAAHLGKRATEDQAYDVCVASSIHLHSTDIFCRAPKNSVLLL